MMASDIFFNLLTPDSLLGQMRQSVGMIEESDHWFQDDWSLTNRGKRVDFFSISLKYAELFLVIACLWALMTLLIDAET